MNPLEWRYATKKFDPTKRINSESLNIIRDAMRMAPSSYGLQPFKVLQVSDVDLKSKLKSASFNQSQVEDCSHLFVFCIKTNLSQEHVDQYISLISRTRELPKENLATFEGYIVDFLKNTTQENIANWATKQVYIALGFLLMACAENKIDACPMEGFEPESYKDLLNLDEQHLLPVVVAATGYRSQDDKNQSLKKVRESEQNFFVEI